MQKSTFDLEKKYSAEGCEFIIGIDEVGRGPLAGPVVSCAAAVRKSQFPVSSGKNWDLIRDSKTLSAKQREKLFDFIQENFYVGIGIIDHKTIDRINILESSFLAMKAALNDLQRNLASDSSSYQGEEKKKSFQTSRKIILVDGNKKIPNLSLEQKAIPSGDKYVKSISAASIIAKVTRDRLMLEMHEKYPEYFFDKHKGYGTKLHMEMLSKFGPCEIHRKSFEPMASLVKRGK